jgi:nitrogen fixation/metabolism regulation signal transduction histidine kinase
MAFKDTLLNILKGAAESIEESTIEAELQELHDADKAEWLAICDGGEVFATKIAERTKSGFVKAVLQGVIDAIQASRESNPDTTATPAQ